MTGKSERSTSTGTSIKNDQEPLSEYALCLMWRQVIAVSITDAMATKRSIRLEVLEWINSEDFGDVCDFAGINGEALRPMMLALFNEDILMAHRKKRAKDLRNAITRIGLNKVREGASNELSHSDPLSSPGEMD